MRGELIGVWPETWREIWTKLAKHREYGDDLFPDLCRELVTAPIAPAEPAPPVREAYNDRGDLIDPEAVRARDAYMRAHEIHARDRARYEEAVGGGELSRQAFHRYLNENVGDEAAAMSALERAHTVVASYGDGLFSGRYFRLVDRFLEKYSLRYDLRRPVQPAPDAVGDVRAPYRRIEGCCRSGRGAQFDDAGI